jgi:hypothetical protein
MNYLTKKPDSDVYYATVTIPPDVRPTIGRGVRFFQSTKTKSEPEALRRATVLVSGWRAEIAKAKGAAPNPKDTFWESLRRQYIASDDDTQMVIEEVAEQAASKLGNSNEATLLFKLATDQAGTPLKPLVGDWQGSLRMSQKTIDQRVRDVTRMADHFFSVEAIQPKMVKAWTDGLMKAGATAATLERMGNGCHSFWRYLTQSGTVEVDAPNPFSGSFSLARTTAKKVTVTRKAFTAEELSTVYQMALSKGDDSLARVIALGAFTGARIEEICSLKLVNCTDGIFNIVDSKTDAGIRQVPIHPALVTLVDKMTKGSTDGYLVPSKAAGKYGVRSDHYTKRFGKLKEAMGFSKATCRNALSRSGASVPRARQAPLNSSTSLIRLSNSSVI